MMTEIIQQAFKLAYFIHRDRRTAMSIALSAVSKLDAEIKKQIKRTYQPPITQRTKVSLSDAILLQRLVFIESESYELERERAINPRPVDEESLIVHYIKHLARLAFKNNSFYATLCASRLLHNYSTKEAIKIYEEGLNSNDFRDEDYYRRQKKNLLAKLKTRFENFITVVTVQHREERIKPNPNSPQFCELVKQCLDQFKPWKIDFHIPSEYRPGTYLKDLQFDSDDPDHKHEVEMRRLHAVLHYDCYERLTLGLGFDPPATRLEVPSFAISQASNPGDSGPAPPRLPDDIPELTDQEIESVKNQIEKESGRRKKATARIIRLVVDGLGISSFDTNQSNSIRIELPEDAELIELYTSDEEGDLLLATHLLSYSQDGIVNRERLSIRLDWRRNLLMTIAQDSPDESPRLEIVCHRVTFFPQFGWVKKNFVPQAEASAQMINAVWYLIPRSALSFLLLLTFGVTSLLIFHLTGRTLRPGEVAQNQTTNSPRSDVAVPPATPSPQPLVTPEIVAGLTPPSTIGGARPMTDRSFSRSPLRTFATPIPEQTRHGPTIGESEGRRELTRQGSRKTISPLAEVRKLMLAPSGDEQTVESLQAALKETLKEIKIFRLTASEQEADAQLKIEISEKDGKQVFDARIVVAGGRTIWPKAIGQRTRDRPFQTYQGTVEEVARKITNDLLDELKASEKK